MNTLGAESSPAAMYLLGRRGARLTGVLEAAGAALPPALRLNGRTRSTFLVELIQQWSSKTELVVSDAVESTIAADAVARLRRRPLVAQVHGNAWAEIRQGGGAALAMRVPGIGLVVDHYGSALRRARTIVPCARFLGDRIREEAGVEPDRIVPIPYAVDAGRYARMSRVEARRHLGWDSAPVVLSITNFRFPAKVAGLEERLTWMRALLMRHTSLRWIVAGGGPAAVPFAQKATSMLGSDASRFELAGFVRDMPTLLAASTMVAYFSGLDALPAAVLESQAAERVVVANPIGGVPEMIQDGLTGFLVDDADRFLEVVQRVLENEGMMESVGRAARARVLAEHDPTHIGRRWLDVFRTAVHG